MAAKVQKSMKMALDENIGSDVVALLAGLVYC